MKLRPILFLAFPGALQPALLAVESTGIVLPPPARVAFVTADTFDVNLGGIAGANLLCQQAAGDAHLDNAGAFVALLSDSATDAYCNLHGLTGTRAANCGEVALPVAAGPWIRTDGVPFAGRVDQAFDPPGRILVPLNLDENGTQLDPGEVVWSGSMEPAVLHSGYPGACGDWDGTPGFSPNGSSWATTTSWFASGSLDCTATAHLLCLEGGEGVPLPPYRVGGAQAFVTSTAWTGNLSDWPAAKSGVGVDAGDSICRQLATDAGLPSPDAFVAWLTSDAATAIDRLTYDGPWIRIDGVEIAAGKSDLTDGALLAPLNVTETGVYLSNYGVWTGTAAGGGAGSSNCGNWESDSSGDTADSGTASFANTQWTDDTSDPTCDSDYLHLYCFSNFPAVIFVDDFESAGTSAWSSSVQ